MTGAVLAATPTYCSHKVNTEAQMQRSATHFRMEPTCLSSPMLDATLEIKSKFPTYSWPSHLQAACTKCVCLSAERAVQRDVRQGAKQVISQVSASGVLLQKAVMAGALVPLSYQGLCGLRWQHLICSRLSVIAQHNDQHRIAAHMQPGGQ